MGLLITFTILIVAGVIAGILIYRNNKNKVDKVVEKTIIIKDRGKYLLDALKGRNDKE